MNTSSWKIKIYEGNLLYLFLLKYSLKNIFKCSIFVGCKESCILKNVKKETLALFFSCEIVVLKLHCCIKFIYEQNPCVHRVSILYQFLLSIIPKERLFWTKLETALYMIILESLSRMGPAGFMNMVPCLCSSPLSHFVFQSGTSGMQFVCF